MDQKTEMPNNTESNDEENMYIITRTGKKELLDTTQIVKRLQNLINKTPKIPHVNPFDLMLEVSGALKSGMSTYEIDEYSARVAASRGITNPYYLKVAARIAIDNHQKNTQRSFVDKMRCLYLNQDEKGKINSLVAQSFFKYVEEHQDFIERTVDYTRDFYMDFFGFQTFLRSYSMRIKDKPIERPQDMFMRTAIDIHMDTCSDIEDELKNIKQTYDALSNKYYTHASPTYYNAGSEKKQYASCFLLGTEDSREGIMRTADHISEISKYSGGIGVHINCLRGSGARIRGTNGRSSGIVPWLKIYNEVMKGFNQGGRRPGSAAFYIMPHHPDIMKFIEITRHSGSDEIRARSIFTSLWIPDIFMERVKNNEMWSLFDPDHCGDLSDYTGEEYRKRYLELEEKKLYTSQIKARTIWEACLETNAEVGKLYICFADTANRMFMQKNIGVLKSSNLCSEVYLYSDHKEYAVCILSSLALPMYVFDGYSEEELKQPEDQRRKLNDEFPVNPYFDFSRLLEVVRLVTTNLNLIVDKTFHPLVQTKRGNDRHRPIGIGVQGLDDCYAKMRFPFASPEAESLNKKIFETIYYGAITQSTVLARKKYQEIRNKCVSEGKVSVYEHDFKSYDVAEKVYTDASKIPKTVGAYPSMLWNGGSPIGNGIFHWELAGLKTENLSGMYDWESIRDHVKTFGVRNSLTVACMPTASTSQLLGCSECIEPYPENLYKRNTIAGEFIVVKKYLIEDLYKLGLWNTDLKDWMLLNEGSIQYVSGIPDKLKELYLTAWEIDPAVLIKQSIDRQPFVDQGQSLNLYIKNLNVATWNKLMFMAWKGGLKTGKYYLHSKPAAAPQKFTIDPAKQEEMRKLLEKMKHGIAAKVQEQPREVCDVCSA